MILQIQVEGGHKGADLVVKHELGSTKCERKKDNGSKFFLSISYLDSTHEISAVTEGWSLMMTFILKWKKPIQIPHTNSSLPLFMTNLNTVRRILSPLSPEKTEACDTDMLVIPLKNNYTNTTLSYNHLKSTDKLMACLLQSIGYLEVRLTFLLNFRSGLVQVDQLMNRERDDDGYPESDGEEFEEEQPKSDKKWKFIEDFVDDDYSIEPFRRLNGSPCKDTEKTTPVCWPVDYIHKQIDGMEDLFDLIAGSAPDKEEYDGHEDEEPFLKQWFFKPVLILWPKNSPVIKYRIDFHSAVVQLKNSTASINWTLSNDNDRRAKVMELRSVINHFCHLHYHEDDLSNKSNIFLDLLKVCISLKAKEEGLHLFNLGFKVGSAVIDPIEEFISVFGWQTCEEFIEDKIQSILDGPSQQFLVKRFLLPLVSKLLLRDHPNCNEAAAEIFNRILFQLFRDVVSYETFSNLVQSASDTSEDNFFVTLLVLEHRQLLQHSINGWISMAIAYLTDFPIQQLNCTVSGLVDSSLLQKFKIGQMTTNCQKILNILGRRYLLHDHHTVPFSIVFFCQLGYLFEFLEDGTMLRSFIQKIFEHPTSSELQGNQLLKSILHHTGQGSEFVKKVESLWTVRLDTHRQHLIENLKAVDTQPLLSKGLSERRTIAKALDKVIPYFIANPPSLFGFKKEYFEAQLPNILYLFKLCNDLNFKGKSLRLFRAFAHCCAFNWCDEQVMTELARFISFGGWSASKGFIDTILRCLTYSCRCLTNDKKRFFTKLLIALLKRNDPLCNVAASTLFPTLLLCVFNRSTEISYALFHHGIAAIKEEQSVLGFLVTIVLLEHRQLLESAQLMGMAKAFLKTLPVQSLYSFYQLLNTSLLQELHLDQTTPQCRTILELISRRLVDGNFALDCSDVNSLRSLSQLVAWMSDSNLTQLWVNKFVSYHSKEDLSPCFPLKSSLVLNEYFKEHSDLKLKIGRLQIAWDKHLRKYLNDNVSDLVAALFKFGESHTILKLDKIVNYLSTSPILGDTSSDEEEEDLVLNFKTLLLFCRTLGAKKQGILLLKSYAGCQSVKWCEPSLLKQFAMFLNDIGLESCIKFIGDWLSCPDCNLQLLEKICSLSSPDAEVNILATNLMEAVEIQTDPNFFFLHKMMTANKPKEKSVPNSRRRLRSSDSAEPTPCSSSKVRRTKKN